MVNDHPARRSMPTDAVRIQPRKTFNTLDLGYQRGYPPHTRHSLVGDETLVGSLWRTLGARNLGTEVHFGAPHKTLRAAIAGRRRMTYKPR